MEVKEALLKRRSVRKFTDEPVSNEMIDELLHAAMSGPSACNKKPWEFYVVLNEEKLKELESASMFSKISAKLAIIVCGNFSNALPKQMAEYWIQDCSAATENILLRVTDLALGATTLPASVAYIFLAIVLIDCTVMIILMETICKW